MKTAEYLSFVVNEIHTTVVATVDDEGLPVTAAIDILRSLMNIRMPRKLDDSVLALQDEYLRERIRENGIVELGEIPVIRDGISIWQGDITRLAADAIVNAANSQMLGCFVPMHTCIDNCIHTFAGVQLRAECNRQMLKLLGNAVEIMRKHHKNGEEYYWVLYYTFLSPQEYRNAEEIVDLLRPHIQYISYRTYYRKRREAVEALSSILWGFSSKENRDTLDCFFPDDMN